MKYYKNKKNGEMFGSYWRAKKEFERISENNSNLKFNDLFVYVIY